MPTVFLLRAALLSAVLLTTACARPRADGAADTGAVAASPASPGDTAVAEPASPPQLSVPPAVPERGPGPLPAARAAMDTLRGVPAVVGTEHDMRVMLRREGAASVLLSGPQTAALRRTAGADVWVSGTRESDGRFTVSAFIVRSVDGVPAIDGTLTEDAGTLAIVAADGRRHTLTNPPEALRAQVGGRVWVTGAARGPMTFGIIEPRR